MMKVSRRRLMELEQGIARVGNLKGIKFACAMAKNGRKIREDLEDFRAGLKPTKAIKAFEKKRVILCEKHAKKDENGKATTIPLKGGGPGDIEYVGLENNLLFEGEANKLKEEFKKDLDKREALTEDYNEKLDEKINFGFVMVELEDVPEEITTAQLNGIVELVKLGK